MDFNRSGLAAERQTPYKVHKARTTIGLKITTKDKLDQNRAPGQCYDGFLCQLVDLWEKIKEEKREVMPI